MAGRDNHYVRAIWCECTLKNAIGRRSSQKIPINDHAHLQDIGIRINQEEIRTHSKDPGSGVLVGVKVVRELFLDERSHVTTAVGCGNNLQILDSSGRHYGRCQLSEDRAGNGFMLKSKCTSSMAMLDYINFEMWLRLLYWRRMLLESYDAGVVERRKGSERCLFMLERSHQ